MRRYHIYFEPFVDKIRVNQYIGLDMSFYSELLPVESLIYILDTVIIDELTFRNNKRWKEDLQKELGIENIQLNSFDGDDIWKSKCIRFNKINIKDEDKILINKVVDKFSEYSATDLVTLTQHQAPWIDAFSLGENNEISLDAIKDYFSE